MDLKKVMIILIVVCIVLAGILGMVMYSNNSNKVAVNNTTNVTSNTTNATANTTLVSNSSSSGEDSSSGSESSSYVESSSSGSSEPEYGSDEYVDRWDESQQSDDSWAYLHDQPVKTDDDGHSYARRYDEDSGESYWG